MGIIFALSAAVFMTAKDIVSKKLSSRLDGTFSAFASFAYALPFYFAALAIFYAFGLEVFDIRPGFWSYILIRSVTDTFAEWMKMSALAHCELSVVSSLLSLAPVFLLVISPIITGDHIPPVGAAAVIVVVVGNLLIISPKREGKREFTPKGVMYAAGAAFFFSLNTCYDRLAVRSASPIFSGFVMTALAGMFLYPLVLKRRSEISLMSAESKPLTLRGLLELVFMVSKLYALKYLPGPYVVGIQRSSLLLSIAGGRIFLGERHLGRKLLAGFLIFGGVAAIILLQ